MQPLSLLASMEDVEFVRRLIGPYTCPIFACVWFVVIGSIWLIANRRTDNQKLKARRQKLGLCTYCGYNLAGNRSGVCPECGTKVVA
jgi:uncharacterized paraquat-inducible protein A